MNFKLIDLCCELSNGGGDDNTTHVSAKNAEKSLSENDRARENLTKLLDNIIFNYDNSLRPGMMGPPLTVKVDMFLLSIGPMIEQKKEFYVEVFFRQRWEDERLRYSNGTAFKVLPLNSVLLESIWYPDTYFHNDRNSKGHDIIVPNRLVRIYPEGNVLYTQRLTVLTECVLDLKRYPHDTQVCSISMGSNTYSESDLIFQWLIEDSDNASVDIESGDSKDIRLSQFSLLGWKTIRSTKPSVRIGNRTVLTVNFELKRNIGLFIIQTYVPCSMMVVISWVSFWINREATPARVSLAILTILTITTLSLTATSSLPQVSYVKAIDVFIFDCFCFVFAALLEFAFVSYFTKRRGGTLPEMDDEDDHLIRCEEELGLTGIGNHRNGKCKGMSPKFRMASPSWKKKSRYYQCCYDVLMCFVGSIPYRQQRARKIKIGQDFNSVSIIDQWSRVVFPLMFLITNIIYWLTFGDF
ncbi:gamma-aminobutyric acid receptor subunit alpha-2-like [Anneissia japonica]|uniref:gamma-aminobutyric acid receptor subunit alpha-2-like n=1 Tax=Anneissia japonica TaxID=1529436 RepID=UPI0014259F27|nr:gamma-aminobutyric acid receptor subunit alpha-2-like [Anneissia japonica]